MRPPSRTYLTFPLLSREPGLLHASLLKDADADADTDADTDENTGENTDANVDTFKNGIGTPCISHISSTARISRTSLTLEHFSWSEIARQTSLLVQQAFPPVCWVKQCHGTKCVIVQSPGEQAEPADAMITQTPGLTLMLLHADCQALLFYDPVQQVIAAAHVGWRGSAAHLPARVIEQMQSIFHVRPETLLVAISPSIGPAHAYYPHYLEHFPKHMWRYQIQESGYFDFWNLTYDQLCAAGVLPSHIACAHLCTFAHPEYCFSHRRDGPNTGRHGTFIALTC